MKTATRLFALLMALVMVFGLATTAMAAETFDITINDSAKGHTYEAYQIFKGEISGGVLINIDWGSDIDGAAFLAALLADETKISNADGTVTITFKEAFGEIKNADDEVIQEACKNANDVALRIKAWTDNGDRMQHFARLAAKYLKTPTATTGGAEATSYVLKDLPAGYYLIKDAAYPDDERLEDDFYTDIILSVVTHTTVEVKGDIPSVEKKVSLDPVTGYKEGVAQEIGKYVYFKLTAHLPSEYDEYKTYYLEFTDTMSAGLKYEGIESVTLNYLNVENEDEVVKSTDSNYPEVVVDGDGPTNIRVFWEDTKAAFPEMTVGDTLEVVLKAQIDKDAIIGVEGNPNEVKLVYSNDPNGTGKGITKEDEAIAYTFDMDVIKTVKGETDKTTTTLEGAKFVLLHKHGSTDVFAKLDANGKLEEWVEHHELDACPAGTHTEDVKLATILVSVKDQVMVVDGLTGGLQYYLREVEAPAQYNKLFSDIPLMLNPVISDAGKITDFTYEANSVTVNPEENGTTVNTQILVNVENSAGTTLPSTGGMGTTVFYVIGGILFAGAAILLVTKKRMSV